MKPVCQLEDFVLRRLSIEWHEPGDAKELVAKSDVTYEVRHHVKDAHRYLLVMTVHVTPVKPPRAGYEIQAVIQGEFTLPIELDAKVDPGYLIRLNGLTMLYGLLRGHVAQSTGCFPWGKFIMPAVMMQDVIKRVESARKEAAGPATDAKKPEEPATTEAGLPPRKRRQTTKA